jgi:oligopeptide transport system substrate-binding protein
MAAVLALSLAAGLGSPSAWAGGVLDIGNGPPSETLDPHRAIGVPDARIIHELFEGLVMTKADGSVGPGAADFWTVTEDGLVWTFHLNPNGRWSDGSPVTADDFVHGMRRALDPATRAADPRDLFAVKNAEAVATGKLPPDQLGVRAVDPNHVEIELARPTADFLIQLSNRTSFPVHRAGLAQHGDAWTRTGNLVSNGRMMLAENVPQSHVKVVPNPHHRDRAKITLDAIVFHQTEDANTALKRFRGGELDVSYFSPVTQIQWMQENLPTEFRVHPTFRTFYLTPNFTVEPWKSNAKLRQALMLAVDRDILAEKVTRGVDRPAWTMVPPGTGGYEPTRPEWASWTQAQRDAEAKRLIQEAGFGPGGQPLEIEILYQTEEIRRNVAVAIAAMWQKALGVKVVLTNSEARVVWDRLRDRSFESLVYDSWIDRQPSRFLDLMLTAEFQNNGGYSNPAYDALIGEAMGTPEKAQYHERLRAAETMILADAAVIPILHAGGRILISPKVEGWEDSPIQMTPLAGLTLRTDPTMTGRPVAQHPQPSRPLPVRVEWAVRKLPVRGSNGASGCALIDRGARCFFVDDPTALEAAAVAGAGPGAGEGGASPTPAPAPVAPSGTERAVQRIGHFHRADVQAQVDHRVSPPAGGVPAVAGGVAAQVQGEADVAGGPLRPGTEGQTAGLARLAVQGAGHGADQYAGTQDVRRPERGFAIVRIEIRGVGIDAALGPDLRRGDRPVGQGEAVARGGEADLHIPQGHGRAGADVGTLHIRQDDALVPHNLRHAVADQDGRILLHAHAEAVIQVALGHDHAADAAPGQEMLVHEPAVADEAQAAVGVAPGHQPVAQGVQRFRPFLEHAGGHDGRTGAAAADDGALAIGPTHGRQQGRVRPVGLDQGGGDLRLVAADEPDAARRLHLRHPGRVAGGGMVFRRQGHQLRRGTQAAQVLDHPLPVAVGIAAGRGDDQDRGTRTTRQFHEALPTGIGEAEFAPRDQQRALRPLRRGGRNGAAEQGRRQGRQDMPLCSVFRAHRRASLSLVKRNTFAM